MDNLVVNTLSSEVQREQGDTAAICSFSKSHCLPVDHEWYEVSIFQCAGTTPRLQVHHDHECTVHFGRVNLMQHAVEAAK